MAMHGVMRVLVFLIAVTISFTTAAQALPQERIEQLVGRLREQGHLDLQGVRLASAHVLPAYYQARGFQPAWADRPDNVRVLASRLAASTGEGLDPDDYFIGAIDRLLDSADGGGLDADALADLDLLLTEALLRYAYHLRFGKVNPERLDQHWNYSRSLADTRIVDELTAAIESPAFGAVLNRLAPRIPLYNLMQRGLREYREIAAAGGWPAVPAGPTLKPGMRDQRVISLRARLRASGDLAAGDGADPDLFDEPLELAVRRFQERHNLDADGVVGKDTLAEMNVSAAARVDQIRVNLERTRWVAGDIPDTFLVVDIAGFRARLFRNGEVVWDEKAQVGKPYRKTPIFRSDMTYLQINPTWTVPPTILKKDVLPAMRKDPGYLRRKNLRVLTFDGKAVDASTIDWANQDGRSFPYLLRQEPGPENALGRIKFMFPNSHFVYLHDTPSKDLFDKNSRAFSSGCVRVQNPFRLAELVLNDPANWSQAQVEAAIAENETRNITLKTPIPVLLLYWTVDAAPDGSLRFRKDIYQRDAGVLAALRRPFAFDVPRDAVLPE